MVAQEVFYLEARMNAYRTGAVSAALFCSILAAHTGCGESEPMESSQGESLIAAPTANVRVSSLGIGAVSETSVAFANGRFVNQDKGPRQGRWAVGYNSSTITSGTSYIAAAWSYSADALGQSWTTARMVNPLDFGYPGVSPTNGTAFAGWRGDPSLAC